MISSAPKAVVFDWDNTLVDSWDCILEAYNRTFRHFGMAQWSMDQAHAYVAKSLKDSFPALFGARWTEARDVFTAAFQAIHLDHLSPLPGVDSMLAGLRDAGTYLAVVSNKRGAFLRREAEMLGWTKHFGALIGAGDANADKPDPAPVIMALKNYGKLQADEVWFVGDSAIDIECAAAFGCVSVLLRPYPPQPGEVFPHLPDYTFVKAQALLDHINQLTVSKLDD